MSVETTEPAIPIVAAVPMRSLKDLMDTAARDWPLASQPGVDVALSMTQQGVAVAARFTAHDFEGRLLGAVDFDGHWEVRGELRWTRRQ